MSKRSDIDTIQLDFLQDADVPKEIDDLTRFVFRATTNFHTKNGCKWTYNERFVDYESKSLNINLSRETIRFWEEGMIRFLRTEKFRK